MDKKIIAAGLAVGMLTLGALSFAESDNGRMPPMQNSSAIETAVEANNYASLDAKAKAKITQAQFDKMVVAYNQRKAVQDAIKAGDYTAFKAALIAQMPDEAAFQKMVATEKARNDAQAQILTAVQNNDFTSYKAALTAQATALAALHPDAKAPKAPSDAKLQKNFNRLVAYYKAHSKLPSNLGGAGFGDDHEGHPVATVTVENK